MWKKNASLIHITYLIVFWILVRVGVVGGTDIDNRANLSSTETAVGLATGTELGN